jgi:hypothetical protein
MGQGVGEGEAMETFGPACVVRASDAPQRTRLLRP